MVEFAGAHSHESLYGRGFRTFEIGLTSVDPPRESEGRSGPRAADRSLARFKQRMSIA
jgi:hypothetical protein